MGKILKILGVTLLLIALLPINVGAQALPQVVITSIKLGGAVSGEPTEFVDFINNTNQVIDLANWTIEYIKPTAKIIDCNGVNWHEQDNSSAENTYLLTGEIAPGQTIRTEISLNDNSGGSIHITNGNSVMDLVGWGSSVSAGICKEGQLASIPANGTSISRNIAIDGQVVDTNNNASDFQSLNAQNDPVANNENQTNVTPDESCNSLSCEAENNQNLKNCNGIELSEIVPNPAGPDSGNEYVELYNSNNNPIELEGCSIKIGTSTKQLTGVVQPGYNAYYGLTLPNASGSTVELITATTEEVVIYPADMKDGQSWSLVNGQWQLSDKSTPGSENIISVNSEIEVQKSSLSTNSLEPCSEGKYRNPDTNRCKTIEAEGVLLACQAGQVRNPETNRCKKSVALLASLKQCPAGQIRNPETNRCKKAATVASLAACKIGQERNTETNRCRKVAGATTKDSNSKKSNLEQDLKSKQKISYGVFIAMAVLVFGYGIYEYRDNIANFFAKIKAKSTS